MVEHELKQPDCLPDYAKGGSGWWERTKHLYDDVAKPNAQALLGASLWTRRSNPSSNVLEVVDAIMQIRR